MACLTWSIRNPDAGELVAAYEHWGVEIPRALVAPELSDIEHFFWESFIDLSTERQVSVHGVAPIPLSAIRRYGIENYGPGSEFVDIIRRMDAAYIAESGRSKES